MSETTTEKQELERGSASIKVELSNGTITVWHGDEPTAILFQSPVVSGTWDAMWDVIRMGVAEV